MKTPWWFMHKTPIAIVLLPVSWLYYLASRIVYFFRNFGVYQSRRGVICVGNILAGGVGKTPIVRAIATYLDSPVVMRGYEKSAKTGNIGDEASMLSRAGLIVHTGDRKSNVVLLDKQKKETTPIVMDDGFQNPKIKKDVSILVFDDGIGYGNGFLLPAGPLREPKKHAARADAIIIIKSKNPRKNFAVPAGVPVFYAQTQTISPYDENEKLVAFSGIGYPRKFFNCLSNVVAKRAFADHYQYTDEDIEKLMALANKKGAKLITTEKDWVRLPENVRDNVKYARLDVNIDNLFWDWLRGKIK